MISARSSVDWAAPLTSGVVYSTNYISVGPFVPENIRPNRFDKVYYMDNMNSAINITLPDTCDGYTEVWAHNIHNYNDTSVIAFYSTPQHDLSFTVTPSMAYHRATSDMVIGPGERMYFVYLEFGVPDSNGTIVRHHIAIAPNSMPSVQYTCIAASFIPNHNLDWNYFIWSDGVAISAYTRIVGTTGNYSYNTDAYHHVITYTTATPVLKVDWYGVLNYTQVNIDALTFKNKPGNRSNIATASAWLNSNTSYYEHDTTGGTNLSLRIDLSDTPGNSQSSWGTPSVVVHNYKTNEDTVLTTSTAGKYHTTLASGTYYTVTATIPIIYKGLHILTQTLTLSVNFNDAVIKIEPTAVSIGSNITKPYSIYTPKLNIYSTPNDPAEYPIFAYGAPVSSSGTQDIYCGFCSKNTTPARIATGYYEYYWMRVSIDVFHLPQDKLRKAYDYVNSTDFIGLTYTMEDGSTSSLNIGRRFVSNTKSLEYVITNVNFDNTYDVHFELKFQPYTEFMLVGVKSCKWTVRDVKTNLILNDVPVTVLPSYLQDLQPTPSNTI